VEITVVTKANKTLGTWGEKQAEEYLVHRGYGILQRNFRTPDGEIDIIAQLSDGTPSSIPNLDLIVFVEVKTRRTTSLGPPEISVNLRKQTHFIQAVEYYIQNTPHPDTDWRIDVISVEAPDTKQEPRITHFENALTI
jgi:putative endonuclease